MKTGRFSLRKKTILYCALTLITLLTILVAFSRTIVSGGFERVESLEAEKNVGRVRDALTMQVESVAVKFTDWSLWDDAYSFMADGNKEFEKSSLATASLLGMKVDFFIWRLPNGDLRWASEFDLEKGEKRPLNNSLKDFVKSRNDVFHIEKEDVQKHGIMDVPGFGLTFVTIQPVLHSDGKGPISGVIFAGRSINAAMLRRLNEVTHLDIEIKDLATVEKEGSEFEVAAKQLRDEKSVSIQLINDETIAGYGKIKDFFGKDVAIFRMKSGREIYAQGQTTIYSFFILLGLAGLIFGVVIIWTLEKNVISRIVLVASDLQSIHRDNQRDGRVKVNGRDEITALAETANSMLESIQESTDLIKAHNTNMELILNNAEQCFLNLSLSGSFQGRLSEVGQKWFPHGKTSAFLWDLLCPTDLRKAELLKMWWEQITDGFMPFEVVSEQMPKRYAIEGEVYQLNLRAVMNGDSLSSVLAVVTNVSKLVKSEEIEKEQREALRIFQALLVDKQAVLDFLADADKRILDLKNQPYMLRETQLREIHTLKGNSAQFGLETFSKYCHHLETKLIEESSARFDESDLNALLQEWHKVENRFKPLTSSVSGNDVQVTHDDINEVIDLLRHQKPHHFIKRIIKSWQLEPVSVRLQRLAKIAEETALKMGKGQIIVEVESNDLRIDKFVMNDVWSTLVHMIRNSVDHGLEYPEDREAAGKSPVGRITLGAVIEADSFRISISDDGKGVSWEAIRRKAKSFGLAHETEEQLIAALFADGISSRDEVTEMSGRGVGMAAVKAAVSELSGEIFVESKAGSFTKFTLVFPRSQVELCCPNELNVLRKVG